VTGTAKRTATLKVPVAHYSSRSQETTLIN